MNRWLASLPIRGKLILLAALSSSLSLLIAGTILTWVNYSSKVESLLHRLQTQAEITALNSTAAVAFDDTAAALRTLNALTADKATISAQIERADGSILAQAGFRSQPESASSADYVQVRADVVLDGRIGSVVLTASKAELRATILQHGMILLLVMAVAFATALLAAARLQRVISGPIMALADTATRVSRERDFSLRVPHQSGDEVGRLVTSFNDMLEQIEVRDQQLRTYHADLEAKVASRTEELAAALEDAQAAARAKTNFLANMSHEIRTPMTAILGFCDLLADPAQSESERQSCIETVRRNGEHLLAIINDILDLSRIEAGRTTLEKVECSPARIVSEVASLLGLRAKEKGLRMNVEFDTALPATITTDPTKLRQVLINLIGNAVKFTEKGWVRIGVGMASPDEGGPHRLIVTIADSGIGMTPEEISRLFQPFSQGDSSMARRFGGTGLGLFISQKLAALMGGCITVSSKPGVGSTFTLMLDAGEVSGAWTRGLPPEPEKLPAEPSAASKLNCRVLLADDGPDNRRLITFILTRAGAEVTTVENGRNAVETALEAARSGHPFDIVLMDMQMPELDGYTATRQLREAGYEGVIIALTAHAMADDRTKCLEAGCTDYAPKPIDRASLISKCAQWTAGRAAA